MKHTYKQYIRTVFAGVTLITMLQIIASNPSIAQKCGTSFRVGGAQGGVYAGGGAAKYISEPGCQNNIIQNWSFIDGSAVGAMPSPGKTASWTLAYGTPDVRVGAGCGDSAYVGIWGNQNATIGEALQQTLAMPVVQGVTYSVSFCAIWIQEPTRPIPPQYAFRVSNVPLTGAQDPNGVLIGVSDPVPSAGWMTVTLPDWVAPDNYTILTVSVTNRSSANNGDSITYAHLDRVCVHQTFNAESDVQSGWNIISVPVDAEDSRKAALFPTAMSNAFAYEGHYVSKDTIMPFKGYWLKFQFAQTVAMNGADLSSGTIPIDPGWNIIGSPSVPMPVSDIASDPPGITTSIFFGYDNGYRGYDTLIPGKGYWMKTNSAGMLIFSIDHTPELLANKAIRIVPTDELPPPPPDENISGDLQIPDEYGLCQAYPNPFNPVTTIKYNIPEESNVSLKIYNILGQVVSVLREGKESAGYISVEWNATAVASGIYFYRLDAVSVVDPDKSFTGIRKALLLK